MKLKDILEEGKSLLSTSKIEDAEYDATEILLNLLDMDMARFLFECEDDLEKKYGTSSISNLISDFDELINARAKHYPLQYILGETYFMGLRFNVDRDVLIPRADTEILVEKVMADNQDKNISELIEDSEVVDEMNKHIYFLKSDMFKNLDKLSDKLGLSTFDIITANPPYIRTGDIKHLQEEVRDYEPLIALDGDKDGLKYYKEIAKEAKNYLNNMGKIYLEIGYDQAKDVKEIFENKGYTHIETVKDLGGNDRVIIFTI